VRLTDATSKAGGGGAGWPNIPHDARTAAPRAEIIVFIGFISLTNRRIAPLPELGNWLLSPSGT